MATAVLILSLTGGCSGSTSGSIKIFRWQVIIAQLKRAFITTTEPNRLLPLKVGNSNISTQVANSIVIFFIAYGFSVAVITVLLALNGVDFVTAFGAVVGCITNVGSGITHAIGPVGNYADFNDTVKIILSLTMLLGRLEIMTVLVLFTKNFWR